MTVTCLIFFEGGTKLEIPFEIKPTLRTPKGPSIRDGSNSFRVFDTSSPMLEVVYGRSLAAIRPLKRRQAVCK